eukprot:3659248-Alexandrium_andersonii.AAC.1
MCIRDSIWCHALVAGRPPGASSQPPGSLGPEGRSALVPTQKRGVLCRRAPPSTGPRVPK